MRRIGTSIAFVLGLALVCASLDWFPNGSAMAAPPAPRTNWSPCYRDVGPSFECGILHVPLDYRQPDGAAISIAVARLPAADPDRRIGSLFVNPGGPGNSGVNAVLFGGPYLYTQEVRDRFDIVGFDPRGVGRSSALRCFGSPNQWEPVFTPFSFPVSLEEREVWDAADVYLTDACARRGWKVVDHMSTANVARDLDGLREAVGDEQLTDLGLSYGSVLGVTYAKLFPDRVRAVVLDGVVDPIAWTTGRPGEAETTPVTTRLRSHKGAMDTLKEFFRLCHANPGTCAFAGNAAERYASLAARLRFAPIDVELPDGSSGLFMYQDLVSNSLRAMRDSYSWPDFGPAPRRDRLGRVLTASRPAVVRRLGPFRVREQTRVPGLSQCLGGVLRRRVCGLGQSGHA